MLSSSRLHSTRLQGRWASASAPTAVTKRCSARAHPAAGRTMAAPGRSQSAATSARPHTPSSSPPWAAARPCSAPDTRTSGAGPHMHMSDKAHSYGPRRAQAHWRSACMLARNRPKVLGAATFSTLKGRSADGQLTKHEKRWPLLVTSLSHPETAHLSQQGHSPTVAKPLQTHTHGRGRSPSQLPGQTHL